MDTSKFHTDMRLTPALSLDLKAGPTGQISGYASTFGGTPDRHGDIVTKGAFQKSLAEHKAQGSLPAMLWSHQMEAPIGKWLRIEEDDAGLFVVGQVNLKTAAGRDAYAHIESGDVSAFSIGYVVPENGRRYIGQGSWALDEVDLAEISVVAVPANQNARITAVKHLGSKPEAVAFLRSAGLSKTAAQRFAAGGFSALATPTINTESALALAKRIEQATTKIKG